MANPGGILLAFRARLTELGYREGQTLTLEFRFANGDTGRLPVLAAELVDLRPSIIDHRLIRRSRGEARNRLHTDRHGGEP